MFKIIKYGFILIMALAFVWTGLYVAETASHPFATREANITRVNEAIFKAYAERKNQFDSIFNPRSKYNDSLPRLSDRRVN
jgi:hypothetical protein